MVGTAVIVIVIIGVALIRFQPLVGTDNGGVLDDALVELRIGREPAQLVGVHDPGAEFVVYQTIQNTQNLTVRLREVTTAGSPADALFVLREVEIFDGTVRPRSGDGGDGLAVDGFDLGRGKAATLVLTFEHAEPCVDIAEDSPRVVSTLSVEFEVFGVARTDDVRLRRPIAVSPADGGWQATSACVPASR